MLSIAVETFRCGPVVTSRDSCLPRRIKVVIYQNDPITKTSVCTISTHTFFEPGACDCVFYKQNILDSIRTVHFVLCLTTPYDAGVQAILFIPPLIYALGMKACVELVASRLETEYLVSREPHPVSHLFILGTS